MVSRFQGWRHSKRFLLCIIALALMLNSMFTSMTVPLLPKILSQLQQLNLDSNNTNTLLQSTADQFSDPIRVLSQGTDGKLKYESLLIGVIIALKSAVQIFSNLITGHLTYQFGYSIPLFFGVLFEIFAAFLFAIADNFYIILVSTILHGLGSSLIRIASFAVLADKFGDDSHGRGKAMSFTLGGMGLGMLLGPILAGLVYDAIGKSMTYLIICAAIFMVSFVQLMMIQPDVSFRQPRGTKISLEKFLVDPYILMTATGIFMGNLVFTVTEVSIPLRVADSMNVSTWQLCIVFIPSYVTYLISLFRILPSIFKMEKWVKAMVGIIFLGFSQLMLPSIRDFNHLLLPLTLIGFAKSMVDSALAPEFAYLMDRKQHFPLYGQVYAISDMATAVGCTIGGVSSGVIMSVFGFSWLMLFIAVACFLFAPILFCMRKTSVDSEKNISETKVLLNASC